MFLADQGRDARIIRDIVTFTHFPAIGPPSSAGHVFLGPFFYYLIAPFLLLFQYNPVGLAYGVSILSILGIVGAYTIVKHVLGKTTTATAFLIVVSFSSVLIHFSRFSWNPNLLPVFSFFTLYFFCRMVEEKTFLWAVFFGVLFGMAFQLHHLAALFVVPFAIGFLYSFVTEKQKIKLITLLSISVISFCLISFPLIYFDFKHDFINYKSLESLFTEQNMVAGGSFWNRILQTNTAFIQHVSTISLNSWVSLAITLLIATGIILGVKKKRGSYFIWMNLIFFIAFLYTFSLLSSEKHPHYYGAIYFSFLFLITYLFTQVINKKNTVLLILLGLYLVIQIRTYYFIFGPASSQISYAQEVARSIEPHMKENLFNFATYPTDFSSEESFIYFLETSGKVLADRSKNEVSNQMFVVCNKKPCLVLNSPSWNISMFGKAKIEAQWTIKDLTVYKLTHEK